MPSITVDAGIEVILDAIVANDALDEVVTPLPVMAFAINTLPSLTDDFKELISDAALHWISDG